MSPLVRNSMFHVEQGGIAMKIIAGQVPRKSFHVEHKIEASGDSYSTKWRKTAADQQLGVPRETPRASLWQHPRPLGCSTWDATESIAESAGVLTCSTWNARSLLTQGTP